MKSKLKELMPETSCGLEGLSTKLVGLGGCTGFLACSTRPSIDATFA